VARAANLGGVERHFAQRLDRGAGVVVVVVGTGVVVVVVGTGVVVVVVVVGTGAVPAL
jgi:hypothetical protein